MTHPMRSCAGMGAPKGMSEVGLDFPKQMC